MAIIIIRMLSQIGGTIGTLTKMVVGLSGVPQRKSKKLRCHPQGYTGEVFAIGMILVAGEGSKRVFSIDQLIAMFEWENVNWWKSRGFEINDKQDDILKRYTIIAGRLLSI